ncbi:MAG TPA: TetR/AcrR family transcriptional regulator [Verrucomicrobiae bacterium]|nr:TetR/AcrR family transcriptional regulator [Verrucomicrobiae bacterium]
MYETPDTKSVILNVAEELFANDGLDRVSVRDITDAAKVHLGAVNYHFGSKDGLIAAVFERRVSPLNQERIAALDAAERASAGGIPSIEAILEAFIRPALSCCHGSSTSGTPFAKLFGRSLAESRPELEALLSQQFAPVIARFESAFLKALPHLSRTEVFWRLKFTFGAFQHWLLTRDKFMPEWVEKGDSESQMKRLVGFAAAGFRGH